jgi:hypothetical protein
MHALAYIQKTTASLCQQPELDQLAPMPGKQTAIVCPLETRQIEFTSEQTLIQIHPDLHGQAWVAPAHQCSCSSDVAQVYKQLTISAELGFTLASVLHCVHS